MLPSRNTTLIPLNCKSSRHSLRLSPSQFGLVIPLNQPAKMGATVLAGVTDPDTNGNLECHSTMEIIKSVSGILGIS